MPGAILAAIMAASIGKVPLPQKGSTRILSFFQGVKRIRAAARVSVIGALAGQRSVSSLMKGVSAGIDAHRHLILKETHTQRVIASCLRKRLLPDI